MLKKNRVLLCLLVFSLILYACSAGQQSSEEQKTAPANRQETLESNTEKPVTIIKYYQVHERHRFQVLLLNNILEKTENEYGPFQLIPYSEEEVAEARGLALLETNEIQVIFHAATLERMKRFRAIKEPLLRGILGCRIFFVHKDNKTAFSKVSTLDELTNNYYLGLGSQWAADINVMKANSIPYKTNPLYDGLFAMLNGKRFDYFSRGINEIWDEYEIIHDKYPNLIIENHLAFYYPNPVYFFVNKTNTVLAERIQAGLEIIKQDGSYKKLFLEYHGDFIEKAHLNTRRIFVLENPEFTELKLDTSWWLQDSLLQN